MRRTAYVNADVITMNDSQPSARALVVKQGKIVALGSEEEVRRALQDGDEVIDLGGRTVLPGFIDAHVHAVWTGMAMSGVDLVGMRSIKEILEAVRDAAAQGEAEWVFGSGYDESIIAEGRPPHRRELDPVCPERPVLLRQRGGHSCVVNSKALELLKLPKKTQGFQDHGELHGAAHRLALEITGGNLGTQTRVRAVGEMAEAAIKVGVTCIHCMQRPDSLGNGDIALRMSKERFPVRFVVYPTTDDVKWVRKSGFARIGGCMLLDGAIESHTAAFFEPYTDKPDTSGVLNFSDDELAHFLRRAHDAGLQVAVHAIGERAIEQMLAAVEKNVPHAAPLSHRIEHFIFPTAEQIERAAALGIGVCAQPSFEALWGGVDGWFARFVGRERMLRSTPLRHMTEAGICVAYGSDSPVSPLDPLFGIHAAANHPNESQRISVRDALKMVTINAARIARMEHLHGSIEVGKYADLVVLSENPLAVSARLKEIRVELTILGRTDDNPE